MKVQIRSDGTMSVKGYVNVVGRDSRELQDSHGKFIEQIAIGAFGKALQSGEDVGLKFNHRRELGSVADGTITELYEDQIGLYASAVINDEEVIKEARAGNLTGWSFAFSPLAQHEENNRRIVDELRLYEVSILTVTPAYIATSIEARGEEQVVIEYRRSDEAVKVEEEENKPDEDEKVPDDEKEPGANESEEGEDDEQDEGEDEKEKARALLEIKRRRLELLSQRR